MADYYDILLGKDLGPERMKEAARQLRKQEAYGTLGALTGDPVMGQMGRGMMERSGARGGQLVKTREAMERAKRAGSTARALGEGFYEQGGEIKELPGYQESKEQAGELEFKRDLALQHLKNKGKSGPTPTKVNRWMFDRMTGQTTALSELDSLVEGFKDEYTQPMKGTPVEGLPVGGLARTLGKYGYTGLHRGETDKEKGEADLWWRLWDSVHTLPERHEMFGSALTATEKGAWDRIAINNDMKPEQIRAQIKKLQEIANRALARERGTFTAMGVASDVLGEAYGEYGAEQPPGVKVEVTAEQGTDAPPEIGEIVDGYKFLGGDPNDEDSWERVQ